MTTTPLIRPSATFSPLTRGEGAQATCLGARATCPLAPRSGERVREAGVRGALIITLLLLATTAFAGQSLVLLPFDNVSGVESGRDEIARQMTKAIAAKGWNIVAGGDVEKVLETERVRYLDSLDDAVRTKILTGAGAAGVVSGTLYTYNDGRNPVVALSARMVRLDGTLAWADVAGMSADDTEALLGFGRQTAATKVAKEVIDNLMRRFPASGAESTPVRGKSKPIFKTAPASFRAAELDRSTPHRVCVLPFENDSTVPEAGRVVADVLAVRMAAANGFEVVEPAALRSAALKAHIASFRTVSSDDLSRLSALVGTSLFLRGTIFRYIDTSSRFGASTPELQLEMTLVDAQNPKVLWSVQHDRKGTDYLGFLMLGAVSNGVTLTDRVVSEMIQAEARGRAGNGKAAAARKKVGNSHEARNNPCSSDSARQHDARCQQ